MNDTFIDISTPVSPGIAVWPGDTDYRYDLAWTRRDSGSVNVGRVVMSTHTGTHVDAPFHYVDGGCGVDKLSIEAFVGPARVVRATGTDVIDAAVADTWDLAGVRRLLIRTDRWSDRLRFPLAFPHLTADLATTLGAHGVMLVGVDLPSVDPANSKMLPAHHGLHRQNIAIIEGLELAHVSPGDYELIAVPLALVGADASPVRALLRPMRGHNMTHRAL